MGVTQKHGNEPISLKNEKQKMTKLNPKEEWKILNYEVFENRPKEAPYPKDVVKRRELLLSAECLLSDYEFAESKTEKEIIGTAYNEVMELYFTWNLKQNLMEKNYSQTEAGKKYFIKMYESAVANNDTRIINFCKCVFECYGKHGINGHIPRPNGKK